MTAPNDRCVCGCRWSIHTDKPGHPCLHDITAWWPDPVLVGYQATQGHCTKWEPA